jgi:hypothetical protein
VVSTTLAAPQAPTEPMPKCAVPRIARALGAAILGLTATGIGTATTLRQVFAFTIVGVFGWMVCSGHRRARNYEWAIIGPYAVGLLTPLGVVTLIVNVAATTVNRRTRT